MKKWVKASFTAGVAATLTVPAVTSAASFDDLKKMQQEDTPDILKELLDTKTEKNMLAYQKLKEHKEQLSEDTIVVKYDKALPKSVHQKAGVNLVKSIPALGYDVVKLKKGQKLQTVLSYYSSLKNVKSASQSVQYKALGMADPKKGDQYHQSLLKIDEALQLAGKNAVTVAVIDTGLDSKHPDLKSQLLPPYNAADPANGAYTDMHGTHVAGIIAAGANNGIGGQGIAPNAKILPIDVFNGGYGASDYVIAEGILYAIEKGADVINMSLGGYMESPIMEEAVQKAIEAGVTVVAAAGNEATDEYSSPAHYEGVISVGATNEQNELAEFSNFGPSVDIVAPGEDVYSTVFDYMKGSSYVKASGTSMASPVVAGVAALLKSKYPELTPFEVEYILEQTATNLGEKGYDLKFANGLVNPVAALKYDIKNLPKQVAYTTEEKLKVAKALKGDGEGIQTGTLDAPEERHFYKIELNKGEYLQTVLEGPELYDYGMELEFIPAGTSNDKKAKPIKVNATKAGAEEGYLYKAEEKGTLLVTIKDANGNYSANGDSSYTLTSAKLTEIVEDDSSRDNIIPIDSIPYQSAEDGNGPFTLYSEAEEGDQDYFSFSVEEPQLLSIDLSSVPGVNSTLALYFKEDFEMERPEDLPEYEMWPYPVEMANSGGKGAAERLVFEAVPGMEYVLEVSGAPSIDSYFLDPFFMGFNLDLTPGVSSISYDLNINELVLPADEDGGPMMGEPEEDYLDEEITEEEYMAEKKSQFEKRAEEEEYYRMFEEEQVDQIVESALPFEIGEDVEAYFQYQGDEDFFTFTSDSDSIYEFTLESGADQYLYGTVYEYDEKHHDLLPIADMGYYYGTNQEVKLTITLEKGKKYFIQMMDEMGTVSFEPYTIKSAKLMDTPEENDSDQNEFIRAKVLKPGQAYKNSLVKSSDVDIYYYKHREEEKVFNLQLTPQPFTADEKKTLPKSVQSPLFLYTMIVEDTNGNMRVDDEEASKAVQFGPTNTVTYEVNASFKAKKNAGYFVVAVNDAWGTVSVQPYHIQLNNLSTADEDKDSVVKNNIPSKPLSLKADKSALNAQGYFNTGVDFGDKDYYALEMKKKGTATITLDTESSQDGVIKVIDSKGHVVKEFDYYGVADIEVGSLTLEAGKYYIEVSEAMNRASVKPYEVRVVIK